ncbi:MAG: FKBP-type peptidyl-prolyl cis-trans isomerase [Phaeodactylibacter sp.]|uniref:FKBP-type peptidyl-prolyl cis-trans isomerase n=1 Tax=Phaeodactylibacter sp. TaxID=1940289 RepID=UPI0032EE7D85
MLRLLLLPFLFALLAGCSGAGSDHNTQAPPAPPEPAAPAVNEDEAIMQLSAYLIAAPATLAEEQQNAIVNYAIDEIIPLQRTNSGLFYRILDPGNGQPLKWGDYVRAHYKGYMLNGKVFDSSYRKDRPMKFYIGNMIDGWNEGLQLIKEGGRMQLFVPSQLGYKERGVPNGKDGYLIPPDTPLVFEVEVLSVEEKPQ